MKWKKKISTLKSTKNIYVIDSDIDLVFINSSFQRYLPSCLVKHKS